MLSVERWEATEGKCVVGGEGPCLPRRRGKSGSWRTLLGKGRADAEAAGQDAARRSVYALFCSSIFATIAHTYPTDAGRAGTNVQD